MLSAFNALTLSPALAGLLLRPKPEVRNLQAPRTSPGNSLTSSIGYWESSTNGFVRWSHAVNSQGRALVLVLLAGFGLGAFFFGSRLPSSFMPDEDPRVHLRQHATPPSRRQ